MMSTQQSFNQLVNELSDIYDITTLSDVEGNINSISWTNSSENQPLTFSYKENWINEFSQIFRSEKFSCSIKKHDELTKFNDVLTNFNTENISKILLEYLQKDRNKNTNEQMIKIAKMANVTEIENLLMKRLEFGTAGIRGKMGPGYSQMNDLVIIETTQGLVKWILEHHQSEQIQPAIIIGYDGRYNSKRFAELAAVVAYTLGLKTILFSKLCPTPFIPFAVKYLSKRNRNCRFYGVVVTASHNPKNDNGYKVYNSNGAQIISPSDKEIHQSILSNLNSTDPRFWFRFDVEKRVEDPLEEIWSAYNQYIHSLIDDFKIMENTNIKFTYTPMHGVGQPYMEQAFAAAKLPNLIPVELQKNPDPDFPTVPFPNPEEGKSALNLAMETANANSSKIILANDPDADRLAVAEKQPNGEWKVFNGNEIGALLGWWCYQKYLTRKQNGKESEKATPVMIASTVSSGILKLMAKTEGFQFEETLTGFKWMASKAEELIQAGNSTFIFAFEEAIGFMVSENVLDKDGISAAIVMAELACSLQPKGFSLMDQLKEIYRKYGYHCSLNSYFICYEPKKTAAIFNNIRNLPEGKDEPPSYEMKICDGKYEVKTIRDLTVGYDSETIGNIPTLPVSKSTQMITFTYTNGLVLTLRSSGTEPKIKYYSELRGKPNTNDWSEVERDIKKMVPEIVNYYLKPTQNELISRPNED